MIDTDQIRYGLVHPWEIPGHLRGVWKSYRRRQKADSWEEYYLLTTKNEDDYRGLVGPAELFEKHRRWQFKLITDHGLEPEHTVLELGCGVLRAGLPIIEYLESENYIGMDISVKALTFGHKEVHEHDLELKRPLLIQNDDLQFNEVTGCEADYMLANSVWSHLPPDRVETCIKNMGKALTNDATLLITLVFTDAETPTNRASGERTGVDWGYPIDWLETRVNKAGYEMDVLDVDHPAGQDVICLQRTC